MPTARNGDFLIQALIAVWLGVAHWSNPRPRKLPGVAGFAASAGATSAGTTTAAVRAVASRVPKMVMVRLSGRSMGFPHRIVAKTAITKSQLSHQ